MRKAQQEAIGLALLGLGVIVAHKKGIINLNDLVGKLKSYIGGTPSTPGGGGGGGPSTPAGTVLYDSNSGWDNVETAASGNPQFDAGSDGVGRLSCDASSHGRIYINIPNYNAVMQGEWMFESGFSGNDNLSLRLRSRHQAGGDCENTFGGFGASIHMDGEASLETEYCHDADPSHENSINGELGFTPELGKWYGFRFYAVDSADKSSVKFKLEVDDGTGFKVVNTGEHSSPKPHYMDEQLYASDGTAVWLRMNNASDPAVLAFRNFKLIAQEAGSLDNEVSSGRAKAVSNRVMLSNEYLYDRIITW